MSILLQKSLTRENLIEAFWELYKDKPIEKITVKEITNRAGYNRGTFYAYFKDTYEVLKEIKESIMPSKDMIIYPIQRLERKEDLIFDTLNHSNDYFIENQENTGCYSVLAKALHVSVYPRDLGLPELEEPNT